MQDSTKLLAVMATIIHAARVLSPVTGLRRDPLAAVLEAKALLSLVQADGEHS
jgi:Mg2+/Co2+ transporter CorC